MLTPRKLPIKVHLSAIRMNPSTSYFLNASRWIAALLVLVGHIRNLILVDYALVEHKSSALQLLYLVTGFGHEAVVLFFVISGFLVGGLTWKKWRQQGCEICNFMVARISRIYTVLVPALAMGIALDSVGLGMFNASELYTNAARFHTGSIPDSVGVLDWMTVLGNLFMLQTVAVDVAGSNGPLWSLANEWWYYCIFACVGIAAYGKSWWRSAFAIVAIVLLVVLPLKMTLWGLIWVVGIAAHKWIESARLRPHPALGLGTLALVLVISRQSHGSQILGTGHEMLEGFLKDLVVGLGYAIALASTSRIKNSIAFFGMHRKLADFSFTTYLFHFPLMLFFVAAAFQLFGWEFKRQPDVLGLTYLLAMATFVYAICYLISLMTERKTNLVRRGLGDALRIS